jgi:hypothetical protein
MPQPPAHDIEVNTNVDAYRADQEDKVLANYVKRGF